MLINVVTHCCMFTIWQEIFMAIMKFEYCVSCVEQPQLIYGHWQTTNHIRATTPPTTFEQSIKKFCRTICVCIILNESHNTSYMTLHRGGNP